MALVRVLQKVKQLLQLPVYLAANRPAGAPYARAVRMLLLFQMSNNASLATQEREKERMSYVKRVGREREKKKKRKSFRLEGWLPTSRVRSLVHQGEVAGETQTEEEAVDNIWVFCPLYALINADFSIYHAWLVCESEKLLVPAPSPPLTHTHSPPSHPLLLLLPLPEPRKLPHTPHTTPRTT